MHFVQFARRTDDRPLRVLVADDHPDVRRTLERFLGLKGAQVTAVPDGVAALQVLASSPDFDLVISDVSMPILDGIAFWEEACARWPAIRDRWIFLTATHPASLPPEAHARYLSKPVDLSALWEAVREVVGEG